MRGLRLRRTSRRLAEERGAGEGGCEAGAGERGEGPAEPGAVGERWQGQRGDKAAEGTFAWRIPSARPRSDGANQCITARPLAALTLAPSAPAATRRSTSCAKPEAIPTHARAIAEVESPSGRTIRSPMRSVKKAPRQERGCHPDPERRERDARLAEAEVELLPELGCEHGDADRRRGNGRLCCRPDGEHHPAVPRSRSPSDATSAIARLSGHKNAPSRWPP